VRVRVREHVDTRHDCDGRFTNVKGGSIHFISGGLRGVWKLKAKVNVKKKKKRNERRKITQN